MASFVLIDLCFPAVLAEPRVVAEAAAKAGLQAVVYVCDSADSLPDPATITSIAEDPGLADLHPAVAVRGEGFGYVVLVPEWADSPALSALASLRDGRTIETVASARV